MKGLATCRRRSAPSKTRCSFSLDTCLRTSRRFCSRSQSAHLRSFASNWVQGVREPKTRSNQPYLAGSLNNLGNRLSGLGRREEALEATREAADIRRQPAI